MPMPKVPRTLDRFPAEYAKLLATVRDDGRHTIQFHSKNEAYTIRLDLYRYFKSLEYYEPQGELARLVKQVMIKIKGERMELLLRAEYSGVQNIRASFGKPSMSADTEAEQMRLHEQAMAEFYAEMEAEKQTPRPKE